MRKKEKQGEKFPNSIVSNSVVTREGERFDLPRAATTSGRESSRGFSLAADISTSTAPTTLSMRAWERAPGEVSGKFLIKLPDFSEVGAQTAVGAKSSAGPPPNERPPPGGPGMERGTASDSPLALFSDLALSRDSRASWRKYDGTRQWSQRRWSPPGR